MKSIKLKDNLEGQTLEIRIVIGENCNLDCKYCFVNKDKNNKFTRFDDLYNLIKRLEYKNLILTFSGGEPLLYIDEIIKIVTEVKPNSVDILTNGLLLNNDLIRTKLRIIKSFVHLQLIISIHKHFEFKDLEQICHSFYFRRNINLGIIPENDNRFGCCEIDYYAPYDDVKALDKLPNIKYFKCFDNTSNYRLINPRKCNNFESSLKELYDYNKFNFKDYICDSGYNLIIIDYDGTCYPCSEYYRYKFNGVDILEFTQSKTKCELSKCWCFTCKRIKD